MPDSVLIDLGETITAALDPDVSGFEVVVGQLTVHARRGAIAKVLAFLQGESDCLFHQLIDITAVDHPEREERFDVVYNLLSMKQNQRIRVKVTTDEEAPNSTLWCFLLTSSRGFPA